MSNSYVTACYWDEGYATLDAACSAYSAGALCPYVEPCYWDEGYAYCDQPCTVSTVEFLLSGLLFGGVLEDVYLCNGGYYPPGGPG